MRPSNLSLLGWHFMQARWRWHSLRGSALQAYQERHARRIVAYTHQHSPFYRAHWQGHDPHSWHTLPTVNKQLMMEHFDGFNTHNISRDEAMAVALQAEHSRDFTPAVRGVTVGLSSGTSGHRGLFLVSSQEQAAWAGTILARLLHGWVPRRLKVAFFLRSNSNLYEEVGSSLIQFRYFDLMAPLSESMKTLHTFQPDLVIGPPSLLGFLASARQTGSLHITPQRLISVAEVLEPQDREHVQNVFQAPVHQVYQCTEGLLAISCQHGSLHVQEDLVVLQYEPLDEHTPDRVTPLVTDLWRKTQPVIRYRLNDVLRLASSVCPCGSPFQVIEAIEGRCDDLCYFPSHDGSLRPFFPDTLRRMVLLAHSGILDYQVVQARPGQVSVSLACVAGVSFTEIAQALRSSIAQTLDHYGCQAEAIDITAGLPAHEPGRKRRRVQRLYPEKG